MPTLAFLRLAAASALLLALFVAAPRPQPAGAAACLEVELGSLAAAVAASAVIVVVEVEDYAEGQRMSVRPEAYLEGQAEGATFVLSWPGSPPPCPLAAFRAGERVLLFLERGPGGLAWPSTGAAFRLGERVERADGTPVDIDEAGLVASLRAITGQYAVPAGAGDEGASIDWVGTVLPVSAAVLVLFAIALYLMRIWHRIDPS